MPVHIQVLTCSTRPGRVGPKIAGWFADAARAAAIGEIEAVDLADFALPVFDEPHHPRLAKVGSSRVDLQACKLEYSIVSPK